MRDHLDDDLLFAYLDDVLPSAERAELDAHLATCPACAEQLAAHADLFTQLAALPDPAFEIDVVAAVQAELAPPSLRWISLLQVVLIGVGIAVLRVVGFGRFATLTPQLPSIDWLALWQMGWQALVRAFTLPTFSADQLPTLNIPLTLSLTVFAVIMLLWLVGSSLILKDISTTNSPS